jgi:hypothetical protein
VLPLMTCFIPSFMLLGIVPAVVAAVFTGSLDDAVRGYPESAVRFEHCQPGSSSAPSVVLTGFQPSPVPKVPGASLSSQDRNLWRLRTR